MYLTQGLHRAVQQHPDLAATIFGDRVRTGPSAETGSRGSPARCADLGLVPTATGWRSWP